MFPDGVTAEDRVAVATLARYGTLVLPSVTHLTAGQTRALRGYLEGGGRLVVTGDLGTRLPDAERQTLLDHPGTTRAPLHDVDALLPQGRQVKVAGDVGGVTAVNIARLADGSAAVHVLNYGYDEDQDRVAALSDVELTVDLPLGAGRATVLTSDGKRTDVDVTVDGNRHTLRIDDLGLYTVVVLPAEDEAVQA